MSVEMPTVFFSYARADSEFVLKLAKDLRSAGVNLWIDQLDIAPGDRWDSAVENALLSSRCLLVVLSPTSVTSQNVMDEVAFALENNKKIVPVLHRSCEIPLRIRRLQYVDFTALYTNGLKQLQASLDAVLSSSRDEATTPAAGVRKAAPRATIISRLWISPRRLIYALVAGLLAVVIGFGYWILENRPIHKVLDVQADFAGWQHTGVEVKRGQTLDISASGKVIYWPASKENCCAGPEGNPADPCPHVECPMRGKPGAELIGQIGEVRRPFEIGVHKKLTADVSGQLYLGINDPFTDDNSGKFYVVIEVY